MQLHDLLRLTAIVLLLASAACNLVEGTPTPYPTPDTPQIEILAPTNNDRFIEGAEVVVELLARDDGPGVARIELQADGMTIREALPVESGAVPVFAATMNWLAEGIGLHVLSATAYRPDDRPSPPALVIVEVLPKE